MLAYAEIDPIDEVLALRRENAELRRENAELKIKLAERDQRIAELEALVAKLTKKIFGKSSEKMPRPLQEIKKQDGVKADPAKTQKKRKKQPGLPSPFTQDHIPTPPLSAHTASSIHPNTSA